MSMNQTPASERVHIGFFGRRNAGKSSLINAVTGQNLSIVSDVKGTTTDPVYKTMELLPLGPVMIIDTPGIDDSGELGTLRVKKSYQVLNKTDIGILVVDGTLGLSREDRELLKKFREKGLPHLLVFNKADQVEDASLQYSEELLKEAITESGDTEESCLWVSSSTGQNIHELKERIAALKPEDTHEFPLIGDLISPMDLILLVVPIDKAAPKGRLILPQQQTIRAILEERASCLVVQDTELKATLDKLLIGGVRPALVVTDSQAFARVSQDVPEDIPLTSFSILFARYKGNLKSAVEGIAALQTVTDGDKVLIAEGCTHHRQCNDIGTVKLPGWIREYTHAEPEFFFTSGTEFPEDLTPYKLVVHCGACMLNEREMRYRAACCKDQNVSVTNYGILIAEVTGILKRSLEVFPDILSLLD
ncbi:MAG: [FeFe] hydrogenase H-cluster maturation GTPase HydF [Blautia sp.]|nr:[FeFe] hydrogenase H-cluster maturation GTPase HydF [Blautia sp.]